MNYIIGPLGSGKTRLARRLAETLPDAVFLGLDRLEHGSAAAGQSAGLVRDVRPAGQVMASIVEEAEAILRRLGARGEA